MLSKGLQETTKMNATLFYNYCRRVLRSFLLRDDWWKFHSTVDREPQGNCRWNSNSRDVVGSCPSFSCPAARVPRRACSHTIPKANPQPAPYTQVKKVKAHMSQRPKWPELIRQPHSQGLSSSSRVMVDTARCYQPCFEFDKAQSGKLPDYKRTPP